MTRTSSLLLILLLAGCTTRTWTETTETTRPVGPTTESVKTMPVADEFVQLRTDTEKDSFTVREDFTTNADGALPPVHVRNNQGTHATSLSIYNSIVWAEGAKSQVIGTSSGSAAAINLTITDTAIRGGASGVEDGGATTLNTTTARLVSQAPALDANRRPTGSEYREAGRPVPKIGHKDADLLPFKSAPTLGAREISAFAREAA